MNSKVVIAPDRSAHRCGPRSLFSRASSAVGAPRVRTRDDLRTVMTTETVPVEQPGTVVDELRDQSSYGGDRYVERERSG